MFNYFIFLSYFLLSAPQEIANTNHRSKSRVVNKLMPNIKRLEETSITVLAGLGLAASNGINKLV